MLKLTTAFINVRECFQGGKKPVCYKPFILIYIYIYSLKATIFLRPLQTITRDKKKKLIITEMITNKFIYLLNLTKQIFKLAINWGKNVMLK